MSGGGQGFENHEGPRAAPGRAAFSQTQKLGPREGGSPRSHTPGSADSLFAVSCSLPQVKRGGRMEVTISRFRDLPRLSAGVGTGSEARLRPWLGRFLAKGPGRLHISEPHFPHL